ncbi:Sirohydrochlorin ferrochelatase [Paenibacillus uliginis N3/975]|uniref:Sirohydrochlorin ferrochelatase n=1 Tax=Paenibacillus uliginis N3/975 TaxID=1313296 RepID=A0A1X7HQM0_9BACL|nr:CbiX/SirB N-terminal domain-containing protein [Paenibacillus uliginis]SMF90507.1 Sirohydrochlorin ferrochelatase [Paenibacillus uliginis N3/975]
MMKSGVLVISHGSREETWVSLVDEAVRELAKDVDVPVVASYLELVEGRLIQDGILALEGQGVTDMLVIPLFVSSGSTHIDEIAYALGVKSVPDKETDLEPFEVKARVHFGTPVDDDPDIAVMVWDKVRELSCEPSKEVVLLVGHGSRHELFRTRWELGINSLALRVAEVSGTFADAALLNPGNIREKVVEWKERGCEVIVAPLFLSEGYFTEKVIPDQLEGLLCRYSGRTLLPHPLLPQWMLRQVRTFLNP